MTTQLKASFGPWMVQQSPGEIAVVDVDGTIVALVEEIGDAAIMASSKEMLEALIDVHEIAQEIEYPELKDQLEEVLSQAFEKVHAELDV